MRMHFEVSLLLACTKCIRTVALSVCSEFDDIHTMLGKVRYQNNVNNWHGSLQMIILLEFQKVKCSSTLLHVDIL